MVKKPLGIISIIIILFLGAALVFYFFIFYFPNKFASRGDDLPPTTMEFTKSMYPQLLDMGKFFLTILTGVFVASITFSEKIVSYSTATLWSKSLLILCWILLLLSIVSDGVGLVFLTNWYAIEMVSHSQDNMEIFSGSFICFGLAGIAFGLSLTSMFSAGLISFIHEADKSKKN